MTQTLIGLPKKFVKGSREALYEPDAVIIDSVGAAKLFPADFDPIGVRLELNDRRAVIFAGLLMWTPASPARSFSIPAIPMHWPSFPAPAIACLSCWPMPLTALPPNRLRPGLPKPTGLKARTRDEFARDGVDFIIENTGIPVNFGITVALGFIVGVAIVGLTFSLFIRDNIKQFGALKAIGVTNNKIRMMVAAQALLVGLVGYGIGILLAAVFISSGASSSPDFKGFYTPWEIPLLTAAVVIAMILITGWLALRSVLKTEPAEVFR